MAVSLSLSLSLSLCLSSSLSLKSMDVILRQGFKNRSVKRAEFIYTETERSLCDSIKEEHVVEKCAQNMHTIRSSHTFGGKCMCVHMHLGRRIHIKHHVIVTLEIFAVFINNFLYCLYFYKCFAFIIRKKGNHVRNLITK